MGTMDLVNRAKDFYTGDASYGDPAVKILEGVAPASVLKRPAKNAHNAAELLAHIVGWEDVYLKRGKGDPKATIDQTLSFDWKRIDKDEKTAWQSLVAAFENNHKELLSILEQEKQDLQTRENLLNNIMEHDIYHLAQISLIRRILS